jgi:hypothetical protein
MQRTALVGIERVDYAAHGCDLLAQCCNLLNLRPHLGRAAVADNLRQRLVDGQGIHGVCLVWASLHARQSGGAAHTGQQSSARPHVPHGATGWHAGHQYDPH